MKWLLATHNKGKIKELRVLVAPFNIDVVGLEEMGITSESPESGATFLENAMQKARFYQDLTKLPVLADDSGLEVDALNGAPGIHSARFGGFPTHAEKRVYLLDLLKDVEDEYRTARFHCAAVYYDGNSFVSSEESLEGYIGHESRGDRGFGYDPIFHPEQGGPTTAEIDMDEKNRISHRAKAFKALIPAVLKPNQPEST